jgi:hypothetical protein
LPEIGFLFKIRVLFDLGFPLAVRVPIYYCSLIDVRTLMDPRVWIDGFFFNFFLVFAGLSNRLTTDRFTCSSVVSSFNISPQSA